MSWDEVYYGLWHQQDETSDLLNRRLGVWHGGRASKMLYSVSEETSTLSRRLAQARVALIGSASLGATGRRWSRCVLSKPVSGARGQCQPCPTYGTVNRGLGGDWKPVHQVMAAGPGDKADSPPRWAGTSTVQGGMPALTEESGCDGTTSNLSMGSLPLACDCAVQVCLSSEYQLQTPVAGALDC